MGCSSSKGTAQPGQPGDLNAPYKLGDLQLANRFVLGPMTRCRGNPDNNDPNDLMAEYYEQRAGFGLILTECAPISPLSNAFPGAGGIWTDAHVDGWKKIVDRVHAKDGKIVLQIWHCGRATASEFIGGETPLAPSAIAISTDHTMLKKPHPVPKEMTVDDIKEVVAQFKKSAELAHKAGFDGVQIHGANGYLVDQFLRDGSNQRTDDYGGSIENRCKFMLEVVDAVCSVVPSGRVSIRFSPTGRYNDMYDSNPTDLMKYALEKLSTKNLHFVEIKRHGGIDGAGADDGKTTDDQGRTKPQNQIPNFFETLRPLYTGTFMANDGFNAETASAIIKDKHADIVSFATLGIANPDLPDRIKNKQELASPDYALLFQGGAKGYTEYPFYAEWKIQQDAAKKEQEPETKQEQPEQKQEQQPEENKEEAQENQEQAQE